MTLIEKLKKAKEDLTAMKKAVETGEKKAEDLQNAINAVNEAQAAVDAAKAAEDLMNSFGSVEKPAKEQKKEEHYKSLGEFAAAHVKAANVDPTKKFTISTPLYKTAGPMKIPEGMADAVTDIDKRIVEGYRRPLLIADLFGTERISGNALTYYIESTTVEGAPAATAEGAKKPMMSFGDPTPKTVALEKIASYMEESNELVEDLPWLADAINGRGMYMHELTVEDYLLGALLNTSGLGTGNELTPDGIFKAMTTVQTNSGFAADAIVVNPTDYQTWRLAKDQHGQYYGGGYFYGAYGNTPIVEQPNLWGLRTVVTPAIAKGTCVVGAFKLGGSIVRKNGVSVDMTNTNEDDFIKNMITILIEERLVLAVRRPGAFVKISDGSES